MMYGNVVLDGTFYATLARLEREENAKKAAARLRRQRKPKPGSLEKWNAQQSPFFTKLPQEIRHMIYREAFAMLAQTKGGELVVVTGYKEIGRRKVPQTKIYPKMDASPLGVPSLFLVSKQMRHESMPVFWGSMTFKCHTSFWLYQFCQEKQLAHRRRKHNIPALFPIPLVRKIEVRIQRNVVRPFKVLARLWALARVAHDSLVLRVSLYSIKGEGGPWFCVNGDSILAIYHDIRAYQAWRKERGMSLEVECDEFSNWITDEQEFKVCFPGFSDKVGEEKKVVEVVDSSKESSSS